MTFPKCSAPLCSCITRGLYYCTAKNQCRKFETNIPRKGIALPQSQFLHLCLWAIYIFPRSICLFFCRKYVDQSLENINRSKTHECGNGDWGRAIPRKGIHKWDFRCSVYLTRVLQASLQKQMMMEVLGRSSREWRIETRVRHHGSLETRARIFNDYGAQESSPRNEFSQPMWPGGPVR
jgi:hypothetical protein